MKSETIHKYSIKEEIAHAVSHGLGVALAIAGLAVMVTFAAKLGTASHVVGTSIFGGSMILLYLASTLYHAVPKPSAKATLKVVDHVAIYLLIAGTYTPFTLVTLRGALGWTLFGIVWAVALLGVICEVVLKERARKFSLVLYLALGWAGLIALKPLMAALPTGGKALVWAGGLSYTFGVVFYVAKRIKYSHAIWHGFVLLGSIFHFFCVLFYVVPLTGNGS